MEELRACRACLATDGKLHDIFANQLAGPFSNVVGSQLSTSDTLPHHLCSFCAALLVKAASFKQRCCNAENILLNAATAQQQLITTDFVKCLDRESYSLTHPYSIRHLSVKEEIKEESPQNKPSVECLSVLSNVKLEASSDEEPLAKVATKRRKSKKIKGKSISKDENIKVTVKGEETEINHSLFDNIDMCFEDYTDPIFYEETALEDDVKPFTQTDKHTNKRLVDDEFKKEVDVVELSFEDQIKELEARRNSQNYVNSSYKCEFCYRGFLLDSAYKNHMTKHDPNYGPVECSVCHLRFQNPHTMHTHVANTHARNYVCRRCGHITKAKIKAKEHYRWHQGVLFPCETCGASFSRRTSYLTHVRLRHPSAHACSVCALTFVSAVGLRLHWKRAHSLAQVELKCAECNTQFLNQEALNKHTNSASQDICCRDLKSCCLCGECFPTADEFKLHMKVHRTEEAIECQECHKTYANRRYYAAHYHRVHTNNVNKRPNHTASAVCELCGTKCKSKVTLLYHQRIHTGEKPYQCPECPKRFSMQQRLQYHTRTHTGERPCQCPHCPKAFTHKAGLNRHLRTHSGAKPYVCSHCGKGFSQSNSLKGHVRAVHLKLPARYRKNAASLEQE